MNFKLFEGIYGMERVLYKYGIIIIIIIFVYGMANCYLRKVLLTVVNKIKISNNNFDNFHYTCNYHF